MAMKLASTTIALATNMGSNLTFRDLKEFVNHCETHLIPDSTTVKFLYDGEEVTTLKILCEKPAMVPVRS